MVDMPSPLASLWKDRCTIFIKKKVTDPFTKLTDFMEIPVINEEPCKLSFQTLAVNGEGDTAAMVAQSVKLFLSPDLEIPAGCKIVVKDLAQSSGNLYMREVENPAFFQIIRKCR